MRYATLLLLCSTAFAQTGGAIAGKIVDEFGIPVSGALVQLRDASGKQFRTTSTTAGEYTLDKLPAGSYQIMVAALAMQNFVKKDFAVAGTETSRLDVQLLNEGGYNLGTLGEDDRFTIALLFPQGVVPPSGPVPRLPDGKPDLSGYWLQGRGSRQPAEPLPWAEAIRRERQTNNLRDTPHTFCLPNSFTNSRAGKFVHTPSILVILYTLDPPRQIFLDERAHPKDLNPTWYGHSVGHWEGDTLVVDTVGFNGLAWFVDGLPSTEMLHVIERYHRTDLGHLEVEVTIEDPPVLRKPWVQKRISNLDPKEDIEEFICTENEKDVAHMVGK